MDSNDDELNEYLKNLSSPLDTADSFLREHGINLDSKKPSTSRVTDLPPQDEKSSCSLNEHFDKKFSEFRTTLFGNETPSIREPRSERLENLFKSVKERCKNDKRLKIKNWRNLNSLFDTYKIRKSEDLIESNVAKEVEHFDEVNIESKNVNRNYLEGLKFLCENFKPFQPCPPSTVSKSYSESDDQPGVAKARTPLTVEEIAGILAEVKESSKSVAQNESDNSLEKNCESVAENTKTEDVLTNVALEREDPGNDNEPIKTEMIKKTKGDKYEPKKVEVIWSDPRTDQGFANELEEIIPCGKFSSINEKCSQRPELDDMIGDIEPPLLPRNIVSIVKSATDNDIEDWEYSITVERGEISHEEDDPDIQELIKKESGNILEEHINTSKERQSSSMTEQNVSVDTSEFLQVIVSLNYDEVVGTRDDRGKVIGYMPRLRTDEHLSKEYEWTYGDHDSDKEEEKDEEIEDDPASKMEETQWESEHVKETPGGVDDISMEELAARLAHVEIFAKKMKSKENEVDYHPKLKEEMVLVNHLLDKMNVPKAGEIEGDSIKDILDEEVKKCQHILDSHKNQDCPPGKLEEVISSEDEEDAFYRELSANATVDDFETISRPALLKLNLPVVNEPENESEDAAFQDADCNPDKLKEEPKKQSLQLFPEEDKVEEENDCEELHDIFAKKTEVCIEMGDSSDSEFDQARSLDDQFRNEYFKRGASQNGLGEISVPGDISCHTAKSYVEKYFTFPYTSPHLGPANVVRMRRVVAENFPKYREVAFTDLSADVDYHISSPEDSSSDSDENGSGLSFKPHPFELEDVLKNRLKISQSSDDDGNFPSGGEDSDYEPISPTKYTYEDLVNEVKNQKKKKCKRKGDKRIESDSVPTMNKPGDTDSCKGVWAPIDKFERPSEQQILDGFREINKILVPSSKYKPPKPVYEVAKRPKDFKTPGGLKEVKRIIVSSSNSIIPEAVYRVPPNNYKTPKGMRAWLKGELSLPKETLKKWKKHYLDYYGDQITLTKVIDPVKQSEYESFLESFDADLMLDIEETNLLKKFKKIISQKRRAQEEKDKADEIMETGDAPVEQPPSKVDENHKSSIEIKADSDKKTSDNVEENEKSIAEVKPKRDKKPSLNVKKNSQNEPPNDDDDDDLDDTSSPFVPNIITGNLKIDPFITRGSVISLRDTPRSMKKEEWAEEVNCNATVNFNFTPALTYPFELDGFQRQAISALERGYNVFVSAHTSAGKTVVAEYAIAMSKRNRSKAVYTSPVKALSNQKYADFKRVFGSVGLITGDIQLNENAECLIMTTEILRSMLYNSSEKIRDLQFVVFDEVHYINDPERGHVWEEVLILLSSQVQIVMLSATVPNTLEFANWVGRTKQRKVIVCATHHRPVPLNHYLYTGTGGPSPGNTYLLKSGDGQFLLKNYSEAEAAMKRSQERERQNKKKQQMKRMEEEKEWKKKGQQGKPPVPYGEEVAKILFKKDQTMWVSLIAFLEKKDWLPAVVFVFSRKKCDAFADMLETTDLTSKSEKSFIHKFIKSQVEKLDEIDQDLPQIQVMRRQLDKGIGVHHSGILPVMKEMVEVLFHEGKVKLLFATETFAMGVNMPARTVIFHSIRKFDGNDTRLLLPAEYVQMAGRAGRRGKDAAGNVIILAKPNDLVPRISLETLLFVSGMLTVQNMMERSYCENQGQLQRVFLQKDLIEAEEKEKELKKAMTSKVSLSDIETMSKFYDCAIKFIEQWNYLRVTVMSTLKSLRELHPGRLLKICFSSYVNRTCMLLDSEIFPDDPSRNIYKVLVLDQNKDYDRNIAPDGHEMDQGELELWYRMLSLMKGVPSEMEIVSCPNDYSIISVKCYNIVAACKESVKFSKNQLDEFLTFLKRKPAGHRNKTCDAGDSIAMAVYSFIGRTTDVDERSMVRENFELALKSSEMWMIYDDLQSLDMTLTSPILIGSFRKVFRWKQALSKVEKLRYSMSIENMTLYPDFVSKISLLKEKGYISTSEQVLMKGYMAARIGKYELIVCELLVENILVDLTPEEAAALLSFLIYQSSVDDKDVEKSLPPALGTAIIKCKQIMKDVTELEKAYDIRDFEGSEISKLKFGLVPVMFAWAKQEPLKNIMEMATEFDFQEGMLVRWIQQLLEMLKEVESAARLMGDPGVPAKLQAAGQSIKRGIVFAPSLYTTML